MFALSSKGEFDLTFWTEKGGWACKKGGWISLGSDKNFSKGNATAVAHRQSEIEVFACGKDGRIYSKLVTDFDHPGTDWTSLGRPDCGFPPNAYVSANSCVLKSTEVFACDSDGLVYTTTWDREAIPLGAEQEWLCLGGAMIPGSEVTVLHRKDTQLDVFGKDRNSRLYTNWRNRYSVWGSQHEWEAISKQYPGFCNVAAVARTSERLHVFINNKSGQMYTSWWPASDGWYDMGRPRYQEGSVSSSSHTSGTVAAPRYSSMSESLTLFDATTFDKKPT